MTTAEFTAQDIINAQTNAKIDILAQEMKDFKDEMRDFKNEMRQQNAMRADEVKEIRNSVDGMGKHIRNLTYTAIGAIGAMVLASGAMAASVIYSVFNAVPK